MEYNYVVGFDLFGFDGVGYMFGFVEINGCIGEFWFMYV